MALGWGHALVCTTDGELYAWGYAADGRLGFTPESKPPVEGALQISEGRTRSQIAEAVDRQISEQLAREKTVVPVWEPHRVQLLAHERVTQVACGMDHSLALTGKLSTFPLTSLCAWITIYGSRFC